MQRIRTLSTFAVIVMLPFMLYYPYEVLSWNLQLSYLDPGAWTRNDAWVDPDAQISMATRTVFFAVWLTPVVFGVVGYLAAFSMLILLRRGVVFDPRIATRLTLMGVMTVLSSSTALLAATFSPMIRSRHNADGPLPLRFWHDSGQFGLIFCELVFCSSALSCVRRCAPRARTRSSSDGVHRAAGCCDGAAEDEGQGSDRGHRHHRAEPEPAEIGQG